MIPAILPLSVEKHRGYNPPLGILSLAGTLRQQGHRVHVIDAHAFELTPQQAAQQALAHQPDMVGISAMTFTLIDSLEIARHVRSIAPRVPIIWGGPHPSIYPKETLGLGCADLVVIGESEISMPLWLDAGPDRASWKAIPGLAYYDGAEYINTGSAPFINELDDLPFPARDLLEPTRYSSILGMDGCVTTMFTSRGCPYRCVFCDRPAMGKKFRFRSPRSVAEEMEACGELGIREFLMYDDTFTVERDRVYGICEEIHARKLNVAWDVRAHVNTVDVKMLKEMKRAGLDRIHFGVESGNREILKKLNKGTTKDRARMAFSAAREAGLKTLAYFMIGNPADTPETISETIDFAIELRPDFVHFSVLVPFPATHLYDSLVAEGFYKTDHWKAFAADPAYSFRPLALEQNLTRIELEGWLRTAYRRFYRRPSYMVQRLRRIDNMGEFVRQARLGLQIIGL